jgi:hypothetical protein
VTDSTVALVIERMSSNDRLYNMHLVAASYENWKQHCDVWRNFAHDLVGTIERQQRECKWFGEVMAVMHRDGGHYLGEHGPEKATKDALTRWYEMQRELEARDARIAVLVGALEAMPCQCESFKLIGRRECPRCAALAGGEGQ